MEVHLVQKRIDLNDGIIQSVENRVRNDNNVVINSARIEEEAEIAQTELFVLQFYKQNGLGRNIDEYR